MAPLAEKNSQEQKVTIFQFIRWLLNPCSMNRLISGLDLPFHSFTPLPTYLAQTNRHLLIVSVNAEVEVFSRLEEVVTCTLVRKNRTIQHPFH